MSTIPSKHLAVGLTSPTSGVVAFEVPTPQPGRDEVLVRVNWASVSFFELWQTDFKLLVDYPQPLGITIAGEVVQVGENVDVAVGDKVISFGMTSKQERAFQEYALISKHKIGKLPANVLPHEAVSVPDNFVTTYWALFGNLKLPVPSELPAKSSPPEAATPILVWGAGGSTGQYALQVLRLAGYTNVIAVASSHHHEYLRSLGAATTLDYRAKNISEQVLEAAGNPVKYVFDTIADEQYSLQHIAKFVGAGSQVAYLLPVRVGATGAVQGIKQQPDIPFPDGVELIGVKTAIYHLLNEKFKEEIQPKILPKLLAAGLIKPNRVREITGNSLAERVNTALSLLRKGEVSGERLVVKVSE
ncbi:hypothetical protein QCA50_005926 [Cerrena zonata]|uniref:Enoyl reductase (ER) domain-containing protein n=1 Tax=Cerrena zonata TaxID=2478898 RepID=A0AAW0GBU6_9APHY